MRNQFQKLIGIIDKLRSKTGCPWDRKQNLQTIRENIIEEAYEIVDAINKEDYRLIKEETGDLLVQALFISKIAADKNKFTINDVIKVAGSKLIRRHPHVFDKVTVTSTASILHNWEKIKQLENKIHGSILHNIPDNLPALLKAKKVQNKVERLGFKWDSVKYPKKKLKEELNEFLNLLKHKASLQKREEEFGDILFTLVLIGRFYKVDSEMALNGAINKFKRRFQFVEEHLEKEKINLHEVKLQALKNIWKEAKKNAKTAGRRKSYVR